MSPYFCRHSAAVELAIEFPPDRGFRGADMTIADFASYGASHYTQRTAVPLMVERNMEYRGWGAGNRAKRRAQKLNLP